MDRPVVVLTGASRGIGKATAFALGRAGAALALHARSEARLSQVAGALREMDVPVDYIVGDIRDPDTADRLVANALHTFKRIDALVNNAGVIEPISPVERLDVSAFARNIEVNLLGAVWATRAALPALKNSQGRIVNISSGAAIEPVQGWAAYCASKAALNQFTRVCAAESPQVCSVAFSPGMTATDMQAVVRENGKRGMDETALAGFRGAYERGELRDVNEVGEAAAGGGGGGEN
ncbi:MAG: SDR family NAD(P)-dependent oxidoreductase, partial [Gammaproteobacteria bacterium]